MKLDFKSMLIGFLLFSTIFFSGAAVSRETLYRKFGPKLLEAVILTCQDEFNRNRTWHGQSQISTNAMAQALQDKFDSIPSYDWQTNGFGM